MTTTINRDLQIHVATAAILFTLVFSGCGEELSPGQWGIFRYFGEVNGQLVFDTSVSGQERIAAPLRLLPPFSDRDGNVYILHGDREHHDTTVYVGHRLGGFSGGCEGHKGRGIGVRGFVGRGEREVWYWSGDALVHVAGETGMCRMVLDRDPTTGVSLSFIAVVPHVTDRPWRRQVVTMVMGAADEAPYHALVDLDTERYLHLRRFEPASARGLEIIGTGYDPEDDVGIVVVTYSIGQEEFAEELAFDPDGEITRRVSIVLPRRPRQNEVRGFIQASQSGVRAAILSHNDVLVWNAEGGSIENHVEFDVEGLFSFAGELYLTGQQDEQPVVALVGADGNFGPAQKWKSAADAAAALAAEVKVLDERSDPSLFVLWQKVNTGISTSVFVSPHPLDQYTIGSTTWAIAGPNYATGGEGVTSVAFAPVGISVP